MKKVLFPIIAFLLVFAASCSKSPSASPQTVASFSWTYGGVTLKADTVQAINTDTIIGSSFMPEIYAQTGAWNTPGTIFEAQLTSLAVGSYSAANANGPVFFSMNNNGIDPFSINITSNAGGRISGNFSGTLNSQPITGTFTNVKIVR